MACSSHATRGESILTLERASDVSFVIDLSLCAAISYYQDFVKFGWAMNEDRELHFKRITSTLEKGRE